MTKLEQYDAMIRVAHNFRMDGNKKIGLANSMENKAELDLGITSDFRDPGLPCYKIEGVDGYFYTPRQALEALAKHDGE
jgi:hypothetical protein